MSKHSDWKRFTASVKKSDAAQRLLRLAALHGPHPGPPWLQRARERMLTNYYHRDPALVRTAYRYFNTYAADRKRNEAPKLFDRAAELGYLSWPKHIRGLIAGRDVLDIGCGTGVHGIGFVISGVNSYTGVDPRIDPSRGRAKDLRSGKWVAFGWTGAQIMERIPRIRLFSGGVEELPAEDRYDVAVLHNVTEHLPDLDAVLAATVEHLRDDGELIFNHHNFFCWNGHHRPPKRVADIDPNDEEQRNYVDWAHVDFDPPEGHYIRRGLNRLRIHEVREITERYFDVREWTLVPSREEQGAGRLTAAIRARHPELGDEDFLVQHIFCRAVPKHRGAKTDAD